jgi:hypothetical protein
MAMGGQGRHNMSLVNIIVSLVISHWEMCATVDRPGTGTTIPVPVPTNFREPVPIAWIHYKSVPIQQKHGS